MLGIHKQFEREENLLVFLANRGCNTRTSVEIQFLADVRPAFVTTNVVITAG